MFQTLLQGWCCAVAQWAWVQCVLLLKMVSLLHLWWSHAEPPPNHASCCVLGDPRCVSLNCKSAIPPEHTVSTYINILPFCSFLPTTHTQIHPLHVLECARQINEYMDVASEQLESTSTCQPAEPFWAKIQELYLNICGVLAPLNSARPHSSIKIPFQTPSHCLNPGQYTVCTSCSPRSCRHNSHSQAQVHLWLFSAREPNCHDPTLTPKHLWLLRTSSLHSGLAPMHSRDHSLVFLWSWGPDPVGYLTGLDSLPKSATQYLENTFRSLTIVPYGTPDLINHIGGLHNSFPCLPLNSGLSSGAPVLIPVLRSWFLVSGLWSPCSNAAVLQSTSGDTSPSWSHAPIQSLNNTNAIVKSLPIHKPY